MEKEFAVQKTWQHLSSGHFCKHQHHKTLKYHCCRSTTDTFDPCAFPFWMFHLNTFTCTPSPTGKTAVICPSILSHPRFLQQIFQTWKFTRLGQSMKYHFYPPHISRASFISSPLSSSLCLGAFSSLFCLHVHVSFPHYPSSLPTSLPAKKKKPPQKKITNSESQELKKFCI